jgi:voltage-gated potassium channel
MTDQNPLPTTEFAPSQDAPTGNPYSLAVLMLALVIILIVVPITESLPFATWLLRIGISAALISAAVATRRRRELMWIGLFIAAVAAPLSWVTLFYDQPYLFLFSCVLDSLFFVLMAVLIIIAVIRKHLATIHSIFGAISAYLLLGLGWAILYWGLDNIGERSLLGNTSLSGAGENGSAGEISLLSDCIYFSFVTMSTLGFGDITPVTPIAQTLAWTQSVVGQFYMAVLVAWLVSEIPRNHRSLIENPLPDHSTTGGRNSPPDISDVQHLDSKN